MNTNLQHDKTKQTTIDCLINSRIKFVHCLIVFIAFLLLSSCTQDNAKDNTQHSTDPKTFQDSLVKKSFQRQVYNTVLPIDTPEIILTLSGSNTIGQRLAPKLATAYLGSLHATSILQIDGTVPNETMLQAYIPDSRKVVGIKIRAHGSSTSFKGFIENNIDIGMSSRPIKLAERSKLIVDHGDLMLPENEIVLGMDGLAIITHPSNPVNKLSIHQLGQIFSGDITNWSAVGGQDKIINIYSRDDNSGTYDTFKSLVLKPYKGQLIENAKRFESNKNLSQEVYNDPDAIGFTGMAYVFNNKVLKIAASQDSPYIAPTNFLVSTEDYPLSRRLFLYKSGKNNSNPYINTFLNFATSKKGQVIVEQEEFVSQNIFEIQKPKSIKTSKAPIAYQLATDKSTRLSVNFRLKPNITQLDSKSHRDLDRLANYLKQHNSPEVRAIGFTGDMLYKEDQHQNKKSNLQRSLRLAYLISFGLRDKGIRNIKTIGLGTTMPLVSDEAESGIIKNSRVEIWISRLDSKTET